MKKTIAFFVCIFIAALCLYAAPYMMSYSGTYAIPMDSPAYRMLSNNPIWLNTGRMESRDPHKAGGGSGSAIPHNKYIDYMLNPKYKNNAIGNYSDYNMISIGGYKGVDLTDPLTGKAYNSVKFRISVESPAGLNFISLSHPNITRPYGVAAVPVIQYQYKGASYPPNDSKIAVFKNSGDTFDFIFNGITNLNGGNILQEVWYDMILILPGDWDEQSRTLADTKNRITIAGASYELVVADDYSSVVNIRIELFGGHDGAGFVPIEAPQMLSIPISGYYVEGAAQRDDKNATFGMHIMPNNNCANLNINQQQGKMVKIADINLLSKNVTTAPVFPGIKPPVATDPGPRIDPSTVGMVYPKHSVTGTELKERPTEGTSGYYNRGYENEKNGGWPKYQEDAWLAGQPNAGKYIEPQTPRPNSNYYHDGENGNKYKDDLRVWEEIQNKSGNYAVMLKDQEQWDANYAATPKGKEWTDKHNAWVEYDTWNKNMTAWQGNPGNDMFVFFSSNQDPMALNPEPFMLVHENKPGDTPLNSRNHIKFTLVAYDKQDKSTKSFDGTTYFDPMGDSSQFEKFIQTHDFSLSGDAFHGSAQNNRKYEGEIYLVMENKPDQIMIRGKYTEKIFVHVISSR